MYIQKNIKSDSIPFAIIEKDSNGYKSAFNGQVKDDEIYGEGNVYDLGFREYDSRIGRMFSIDPRSFEYPWQTTYAYHRNSPISMIDYLGGGDPEDTKSTSDDNSTTYKIKAGDTFWSLEKKWGLKHGTLTKMNSNLDPTNLQVGQEINKPYKIGDMVVYPSSEGMGEETAQNQDYGTFEQTKTTTLTREDIPAFSSMVLDMISLSAILYQTGPKTSKQGKKFNYTPRYEGQLKMSSGTEKPVSVGGTPNSIYTYLGKDGKAVSNYIYDAKGRIIYQVDFAKHGKYLSGHGHSMKVPGNLGSGHNNHIPLFQVPSKYLQVPKGVQYSTKPKL